MLKKLEEILNKNSLQFDVYKRDSYYEFVWLNGEADMREEVEDDFFCTAGQRR